MGNEQETRPEAANSRIPDRMERNLKRAFYFLLGVTGSATWIGLYELMQAGSANLSISSAIYSWVVVAVLAGVMGVSADVCVGTWRHRFGRGVHLGAATVYFGLAMLAVSLAFAFWWSHFAAQNATTGEVEAEVTRIEGEIQQARSTLIAAQTQLGLAANLSAQRSADENRNGGTCGGAASQTGFGPVAKLRENHAATLGAVRDYAGTRLAALDTAISRATPLLAQARGQSQATGDRLNKAQFAQLNAALSDLARQASGLAGDPGLVSYRNEMGAMAAGYRKPGGLVGGLTCLDPGMASVLEGAQHSLAAFRVISSPKFGVYQDNQATMEAMRRFFATTFGPLGWNGRGLTSVDEFLAYAVSWIVDLCLFVVVFLRGHLAQGLAGQARFDRAIREVADRRAQREASRVTIADRARAMSRALRELQSMPELPFAELFAEWRGERHIVVPMLGTGEVQSRQASRMIEVLVQLDCEAASGVREQLRLSNGSIFGALKKDRQARRALAAAGSGSWVNGSKYRWFKVSGRGLDSLAAWVSTLRQDADGANEPQSGKYQCAHAGSGSEADEFEAVGAAVFGASTVQTPANIDRRIRDAAMHGRPGLAEEGDSYLIE